MEEKNNDLTRRVNVALKNVLEMSVEDFAETRGAMSAVREAVSTIKEMKPGKMVVILNEVVAKIKEEARIKLSHFSKENFPAGPGGKQSWVVEKELEALAKIDPKVALQSLAQKVHSIGENQADDKSVAELRSLLNMPNVTNFWEQKKSAEPIKHPGVKEAPDVPKGGNRPS